MPRLWEKALAETRLERPRLLPLETFGSTRLPYVLLSASAVNRGDTVVRSGEVSIEKPAIYLPNHSPFFKGFDPEGETAPDWGLVTGFLIVRGVTLPSLEYTNHTSKLDVFDGGVDRALAAQRESLGRAEDVKTALATGPEDAWFFSLLILIAGHAAASAGGDVQKILEKFRRGAPGA